MDGSAMDGAGAGGGVRFLDALDAHDRAVALGRSLGREVWTPDAGRVVGPRSGGGFYSCVAGLTRLEEVAGGGVDAVVREARSAAVVPMMTPEGDAFVSLTPPEGGTQRLAEHMDAACAGLNTEGRPQGMRPTPEPRGTGHRSEPATAERSRRTMAVNAIREGRWCDLWRLLEAAPVPEALAAAEAEGANPDRCFVGHDAFERYAERHEAEIGPRIRAAVAEAA